MKLLIIYLAIILPIINPPQEGLESLVDRLMMEAMAEVPLFAPVYRRTITVFYKMGPEGAFWGAYVSVFYDGGIVFKIGDLGPPRRHKEYIDPFDQWR